MKKLQWILLGFFSLFTVLSQAETTGAYGSGFFVTNNGYIATNYHVVKGAVKVGVRLKTGNTVDAKVVRVDRKNDLAILKIEGSQYKALTIQPSLLIKRGMKSYAMGFPLPEMQGVEPKLTDGIVSSLSGQNDEPTTFQISNPIQPGNSGGPLFSEDGKVIGVVTSTLSTVQTAQDAGNLTQNINYAVKSSYLIELLNTVEGLKYNKNLATNPQRKFVDIVQDVDNGTVLIIAIFPNQPEAKSEPPVPPTSPSIQPPVAKSNPSQTNTGVCSIANDRNSYGTSCKPNEREADENAIANCVKSGGKSCRVVAHYANGCMAVAKDRGLDVSGFSYARATLDEAKVDAINACIANGGKNCVVTPNNGCFSNK